MKAMTKRFEKIAIILLILWVLTLIPNPLLNIIAGRLYAHEEYMAFRLLSSSLVSIQALLGLAVQIGVGVWLFTEAKKENDTAWLWLVLGLVFGLIAAVLYFLMKIYDELKSRPVEN